MLMKVSFEGLHSDDQAIVGTVCLLVGWLVYVTVNLQPWPFSGKLLRVKGDTRKHNKKGKKCKKKKALHTGQGMIEIIYLLIR